MVRSHPCPPEESSAANVAASAPVRGIPADNVTVMHLILRIVGGGILILVGCLFVLKTEWFLRNFGQVPWAEQHLGLEGGSRLFYKLIGLLVIIIGLMAATNLLGGFLVGTVGQLFVPPSARNP